MLALLEGDSLCVVTSVRWGSGLGWVGSAACTTVGSVNNPKLSGVVAPCGVQVGSPVPHSLARRELHPFFFVLLLFVGSALCTLPADFNFSARDPLSLFAFNETNARWIMAARPAAGRGRVYGPFRKHACNRFREIGSKPKSTFSYSCVPFVWRRGDAAQCTRPAPSSRCAVR